MQFSDNACLRCGNIKAEPEHDIIVYTIVFLAQIAYKPWHKDSIHSSAVAAV